MWITKQRATQGPVFGSADKFEGLGIFFDTYKNNRPGVVFPYVMAMLGTKFEPEQCLDFYAGGRCADMIFVLQGTVKRPTSTVTMDRIMN